VVEELDEIADSLIVHLEDADGGNGELLLFVTTRTGAVVDDELRQKIGTALRGALSPRHVPDTIVAVPVIPRNHTGKKLELPVKRILQGAAADDVVSRDVLADPTSLDPFLAYRARR
jgi:acetoacetyl-CoA synthetase